MKYVGLREKMENFFLKSFKIKWKENVSVVNDAFPGNFILSFNELEHLKAFGNYLNYTKPLLFGKIQPVVRHNDFVNKILENKDAYKYLGIFDIGGISLSYPNKKNFKEKTEKVIEKFFGFLTKELNLNSNKIIFKIFNGGDISSITKGKYNITKEIPRDNISLKKLMGLGVKKENIIFDSSRKTFLALYLFKRPSPWGYRIEILYNIGGKDLLDIGTIEYMPWKPIIIDDKIIDIEENDCFSLVGGFGLERLLLILNNYNHIKKCDNIFPLYKKIISDSILKEKEVAFILTEAVRTLHRIFTDGGKFINLSKNRKSRVRSYLNAIRENLKKLKIGSDQIKGYLILNAKLNPFYPELKEGVDLVNKEILEFLERKAIR